MWELTDRELQRFGTLFVQLMKKKIKEKIYPYGNPEIKGRGDKYSSGQLYNSLTATVVPGDQGQPSELVITYQDYFQSVNEGRIAGKRKVPIVNLLNWIKIRGLKLSAEQQQKGIAYAINASRKKNNKHPIPYPDLQEWVKKRGLRQTPAQASMSLAFAIQKNIFRYGIRSANIYDKALGDFGNVLNDFPKNLPQSVRAEYQALINAVEEDVNQFLDREIQKSIETIELE